ncbi:MAG: A/G-specific adenine glycosylase [Candidatus Eisenbacteria bacterium]|nr:A/G-specific adenine glycosylase [Candidatus Eisenbacteria bacterium]MCC7142753.1 A/G-specific adenine glycosylase [Candidatus Eisenbacteria bacterium]
MTDWSDTEIADLAAALPAWYAAHQRELPWRATRDPYAIWVSEVMLQQTRVEVVIPYYQRFLAAFPTPGALAKAPEEEVLARWSGLGYYSRARNLRRGAGLVADAHRGRFPSERQAALALPGVGPYTAAAVLSIAYDRPHAAVDGNVIRVLARLFALEPPRDRSMPLLDRLADRLLDRDRPGAWNQAMMELGATVCTPRAPLCDQCPAASACRARRLGRPESFPAPKNRAESIEVRGVLLLLRDPAGRLLLERGRWRLLPSLWLPPILADAALAPSLPGLSEAGDLPRALANRGWAERAHELRPLGAVRHTITRHRIRLDVVAGRSREAFPTEPEQEWVDWSALAARGRSSLIEKALRLEQGVGVSDPARPESGRVRRRTAEAAGGQR